MALIQTLQDNFNDNSFDTGKWTRTNSTQIVEQNQRLELTTTLGGNYIAVDSVDYTYDLTGSYALCQLVDGGNVDEVGLSSYEGYPIEVVKDGSNACLFLIGYSTVYAIKRVGGSTTNVATASWNASTYQWFKIREAGGTVYWDYSSDGTTWNNLASELVSNLFAVTAVGVEISVGTWQAESITTTMIVDNVNLPPVTSVVKDIISMGFIPFAR